MWFEGSPARAALASVWLGETGRSNAVVHHFDREWQRFRRIGTSELGEMFESYFGLASPSDFNADRIVLDAGCGGGRWAYEVASRGPRVIAMDLGFSVELASRSTASTGRIGCVQADLLDLPLAEASVDWAYSLGVLHVIDDTQGAIKEITRRVKPGGKVLLYLYYAFDNRGGLYRLLFRVVDTVRRATSRLPSPVLFVVAFVFAAIVYVPLSRTAKLLGSFGLAASDWLPLAPYRHRSFDVMFNDSVDRFGTAVENRFDRKQIAALMSSSSLEQIRFSNQPPYWCVWGTRRLP
jgi:SAM-dependent methyltransferase